MSTIDTNTPGGMTTIQGGQMSGYTPDLSSSEPTQPTTQEIGPMNTVDLETAPTSPTVITTDSLREQLDTAKTKLEAMKTQITASEQPTEQTKTETTTAAPTQDPFDAYNAETQKLLNDTSKQFDRYLTRSDGLLRSQVKGLQAEFDKRRQQAQKVTANAKAVTGVLGARTGRLRYAPEIQQGILTGQENALITTLSEIDAMEAAAIAAAESAAYERDYETFLDKMDALDGIKKEREKTLSELQDAIKVENERRQEESQQLEFENQVIEQIAAGITDPIEVFQSLQGKVPYDIIKEITGEPVSTKPITLGSADLLVDPSTGQVIARGSKVGGGSVGQAVGYGAPVVSVGSPSIGGLGATYENSSIDAQLMIDDIVNGLPTQLINNVAEIPRWREAVRKQLQAGYTPQQVIDKLSGFRLFEGSDKNLGTVLYNMATGTDLEPQELSSLINRGANEQAMTSVENAQLSNVNAFFAPVDKARATLKQAEAVLNILNDPSFPKDKLGAFDGRTFKIDRASGMTNQDTLKVQQLESALQLLNAPIRVEIVGTAATEAEMAKITGFQSEIIDQPEVVGTKVAELRDAVLRFHNEARQQRGLPTVEPSQLINNSERLKLYRTLGNEEQKAVSSSLSNTDFLQSGSWSSATEEVKNLDNQSFFSRF